MSKGRFFVVTLVACVLSVACLFLLCRPRCSSLLTPHSSVLGSWLSIVGPAFGWPSSPGQTTKDEGQRTSVTRPLFGSGDRVEITVPPNKDTVRIRVTPDLKVRVSPCSSAIVSVRRPLIRFRPTLHLTALASGLDIHSLAFGVKVRPIEIGRFGLAGYVTSKGPGAGLDCRLFGNLSFDAVYLWCVEKFTPLPVPLAPAFYLGVSLRL